METDDDNRFLSSDELEVYSRLLVEQHLNHGGMRFWSADGFLHAVVSGPNLILPTVWMPMLFGQKEVSSELIELAVRHHDCISNQLASGSLKLNPAELPRIHEWCFGYTLGMGIRLNQWADLLRSDEGYKMFAPIEQFANLNLQDADSCMLLKPLAIRLPSSVTGIYQHWKPLRDALLERYLALANADMPDDTSCPCGSGRLFKLCCGFAANLH